MLKENAMKVYNLSICNMDAAIRGMRMPLESFSKADSTFIDNVFNIGVNDLELAQKLVRAGSDHRKFMRQISVSFDLAAPEYFWKQYHTYKVATTENSTSQMHTLGKRVLTLDDFILDDNTDTMFINYLNSLNELIVIWQNTKDKEVWRKIIQYMPQNFIYTKTCIVSYESLLNIYNSRKNEKLEEWRWFIRNIIDKCPYSDKLICLEK